MSFEEELKELILDAKADAERRQQELNEFRDSWKFHRTYTVKPALDQAVQALVSYSEFNAIVELRNGSITLKVGPKSDPKQAVTNELSFTPIEEKLEIATSYRHPHIELESFTLDSLDTSTVEGKIKEFLSVVLG